MTMQQKIEMCRYDTVMGDSTMTIGITKNARQKITELCREKGMTKRALTERIIAWFAGEDATLQAVILGHLNNQDHDDIIDLIHRRRSEARAARDRAIKAVARMKTPVQARKQGIPKTRRKAAEE